MSAPRTTVLYGVRPNLSDRRMDVAIAWVLERYRSDQLPIGEGDVS